MDPRTMRKAELRTIYVIRDFMDAVYRELAPAGTLRAAVNFGNATVVQRDGASRGPVGLAVDLADELARRAPLR